MLKSAPEYGVMLPTGLLSSEVSARICSASFYRLVGLGFEDQEDTRHSNLLMRSGTGLCYTTEPATLVQQIPHPTAQRSMGQLIGLEQVDSSRVRFSIYIFISKRLQHSLEGITCRGRDISSLVIKADRCRSATRASGCLQRYLSRQIATGAISARTAQHAHDFR
jgi:hypothetical protein